MPAIDVLGVEVRQYVGPGRRTLVPRVIGLTGAAQNAKASGPRPTYAQLLADAPAVVRDTERLLLDWAASRSMTTRLSAAARQFLTADGRGVLQLYPGYSVVEIPIEPIRQGGDLEVADAILSRSWLCRRSGSPGSTPTSLAPTWSRHGQGTARSSSTTGYASSQQSRCLEHRSATEPDHKCRPGRKRHPVGLPPSIKKIMSITFAWV